MILNKRFQDKINIKSLQSNHYVGKFICESDCLLTGKLVVKKDISTFLDQNEFKDLGLSVVIIDDITRSSNNNLQNLSCQKIYDIAGASSSSDAKLDGTYFDIQKLGHESPRIYYIYILDCADTFKAFQYPKTWYEFDFLTIYDDFDKDITKNKSLTSLKNESQLQTRGQTHFGYDQKYLSILFLASFIIFLYLNQTQCIIVIKDIQSSTTRWHLIWINLATSLICTQCLFNWIHLHFYSYDGIGIPFINWSGDLLEILSDIIVTTMLLCMATGWLTKFGTRIETDLIVPLALFAALFHMLIFTVDFITDTDQKFFSSDSWVGWVVCIIRLLMGLIFFVLYSSTFKEQGKGKGKKKDDERRVGKQENMLVQLRLQGLCQFFHWPVGFVCITVQSRFQPMQALQVWQFFRVVLNQVVIQFMNYSFSDNKSIKSIIENNSGSLGSFE